jgi:vancomycin resistance protein VanJ
MPRKLGSFLKTLFTLTVLLYLAALVVYLLLRTLFGDRYWWLSLVNTFAYFLFLPSLILLPLALLFRMRGNALRLAPAALIAAMWIAPYYLPRTAQPEPGVRLRALTFNVWGGNRSIDQAIAWVKDSDADIVMLQEITPRFAENALSPLFDLYPYLSSQEDDLRWRGAPNANVTFSRYPILSSEEINLEVPGTANPHRLVIDVEGQPVAVYNVHLAWPGGNPRFNPVDWADNFYTRMIIGYNDSLRNQQIAALLDYLKAETLPYIVAGDFNTSDQSPTYNRLAAQMRDSFKESGRGLGGSWPVSSARGLPSFIPPLIRIDYIWHSDAFQAVEAYQAPPLGSDHLGLVATLNLNLP